jgi:hypothetical protein
VDRQNLIWWGALLLWTGIATRLWILAIRAARRDEKRRKRREDVIEDQKLLLLIADYLTNKERAELRDCANEPDLEFQLRQSVEMAAENNPPKKAS